jgi:uncharacterized membrane protein/glutaredoxin
MLAFKQGEMTPMRCRLASNPILRSAQFLVVSLLALMLSVSSASAQAAEPPVVRAVLFTSPVCTFCRQVVERDLPPVLLEFGKQLEILYVDVNTPEGKAFYESAIQAFGVPGGVPLLFIGETTLGGVNIIPGLPALVEKHLAQGGLDWPALPGLQEYQGASEQAAPSAVAVSGAVSGLPSQDGGGEPVVRSVMFWMEGCPHCEDVIQYILPPLYEKHGQQFELFLIEVVDTRDIDTLYRVAASYNIPREQTGVPLLIIGDQVLVGSDQVEDRLPGLIDVHLAQGGVDWPSNPALTDMLPMTSPASSATSELAAVTETASLPEAASGRTPATRDNGFTLAIVVMVGMAIALLYSIGAFILGRSFTLPGWSEWLIPVLIVIGAGVAGYLAYVETQSVQAICGPVGDCNTVQQSPYAKLFGILPVGVLGLMGYVALLASWLAQRFSPTLEKPAAIGFFGMAFLAVVFSLYLTYLEPFVIRAVCIWCLTSAVIVTLLLLLGTPPAILQFNMADKDD